MTGDSSYLPVIADIERALGRPDRAIALARSTEAATLPPNMRAEMRIVESGARRDLGQPEAALAVLQAAGLDRRAVQPWSARLWYAYADALLDAGRPGEAREWFLAAATVDEDGATDAAERLDELDGVQVVDIDEEPVDRADDDGGHDAGAADPAAAAGTVEDG